ncbi:MAG: hypothetical protein HGA49_02635 [Eubacteriaceae bacterium]|nr:hypothetical protein [Eubacteriaceae bacterium]
MELSYNHSIYDAILVFRESLDPSKLVELSYNHSIYDAILVFRESLDPSKLVELSRNKKRTPQSP